MKAFTDLEQSKKLAEFLPLESADMVWATDNDVIVVPYDVVARENVLHDFVPCWSLAVLMDILDRGALFKTPKGWVCQTYVEYKAINSNYHSNPVDACVEMILELHKQKDK